MLIDFSHVGLNIATNEIGVSPIFLCDNFIHEYLY